MTRPVEQDLVSLREHWAVSALGAEEFERAINLFRRYTIEGGQVGYGSSCTNKKAVEDQAFLEKLALTCELAAIDGLHRLGRPIGECDHLRDQAVAGASVTFEIIQRSPVPKETLDRLFFVIRVSAMACCGDRWSDLGNWYLDHAEVVQIPSVANVKWDLRLFYALSECWIRLFRRDSRDDLDQILERIASLRNDQAIHEGQFLGTCSKSAKRTNAFRLVALYNWAKSTETLARYLCKSEPDDPLGSLDEHFEAGIKAAEASGDAQLEFAMRWLHPAARIMVTTSASWPTHA